MERKRRSVWQKVVFFLVLFFILYWIGVALINSTKSIFHKLTQKPPLTNSIALAAIVQKRLKDTSGDYSITIKNLKTGEFYNYNEKKIYNTASLYKIWVMAVVYQQIQKGALKESDILSEKASILNTIFDIPEEQAEQSEGTITFRVDQALEQMITLSDNSSALLLTEKITKPAVKNFLKTYQFTQSIGGEKGKIPTSTTADISLFFEKLYSGHLANSLYTNKMIAILKKQHLNTVIPKYLPTQTAVAHKTGEMEKVDHDGGIVYTPFGNYIIVMMSSTPLHTVSEEKMALISKDVFHYFEEDYKERLKQQAKKIREYQILSGFGILLFALCIFIKIKARKSKNITAV
jgi:beta-lactamase class A